MKGNWGSISGLFHDMKKIERRLKKSAVFFSSLIMPVGTFRGVTIAGQSTAAFIKVPMYPLNFPARMEIALTSVNHTNNMSKDAVNGSQKVGKEYKKNTSQGIKCRKTKS